MLWTTSSPTPRPEISVTFSLVEKPGRNRKSSSSASLSRPAIGAVVEPLLHDLGSKPLQVDAPAVVAQHDLQHPRAMAGFQPDGARRVLTRGPALLGRFQPMVQRIADQVIERRFEPVEDVAIDPGRLTHHLELRLLAKLPSDVADQAREAADAVGQGPHPAGEYLVVQPAGQVFVATREFLDRLERLAQSFHAARGLVPGLGQQFALDGR